MFHGNCFKDETIGRAALIIDVAVVVRYADWRMLGKDSGS